MYATFSLIIKSEYNKKYHQVKSDVLVGLSVARSIGLHETTIADYVSFEFRYLSDWLAGTVNTQPVRRFMIRSVVFLT